MSLSECVDVVASNWVCMLHVEAGALGRGLGV